MARRRELPPRTLSNVRIGLLILTITVVLIIVFGQRHFSREIAAATDTGTAAVAIQPASPSEAPELTTVGIIGDSWSCGVGSSPTSPTPDQSFLALAAKQLGWAYRIFCIGGTGYTTPAGSTYDLRIPDLIAAAPDIVVVQGSTNDYQASERQIENAATSDYEEIRARLPSATLIVIGPGYTPSSNRSLVDVARRALEQACAKNEAQWIDLAKVSELDLSTDFFDGFHPNAAGHAKLAQEVAPVLKRDARAE